MACSMGRVFPLTPSLSPSVRAGSVSEELLRSRFRLAQTEGRREPGPLSRPAAELPRKQALSLLRHDRFARRDTGPRIFAPEGEQPAVPVAAEKVHLAALVFSRSRLHVAQGPAAVEE